MQDVAALAVGQPIEVASHSPAPGRQVAHAEGSSGDGHRFDELAKALAGTASRRGVVGGLAALAAGLVGARAAGAQTCPPGRVSRRGVGCVCKATGRPPIGGVCPCPAGQSDAGDGRGCLACRDDDECPASDACTSYACVAGACAGTRTVCDDGTGRCTTKACDPATGCVCTPIDCNDNNLCTTDTCDPGTGCRHTPIVCSSGQCDALIGCVCTADDHCATGSACFHGGCFLLNPSGTSTFCFDRCGPSNIGLLGGLSVCVGAVGTLCAADADCPVGQACHDCPNPPCLLSCLAPC